MKSALVTLLAIAATTSALPAARRLTTEQESVSVSAAASESASAVQVYNAASAAGFGNMINGVDNEVLGGDFNVVTGFQNTVFGHGVKAFTDTQASLKTRFASIGAGNNTFTSSPSASPSPSPSPAPSAAPSASPPSP